MYLLRIATMKFCATAFAALLLTAGLTTAGGAFAADPVRIGVTTILSGPNADRGQSEQYGVELALQKINEAGGVLGRPVEAFYGDNAANPAVGVPAVHRLIEQEHVSVILGALATRVTHAIMPVIQEAKIPLIIEISAGQDFVDESGVGGNPYAFKTIPSDLDIARDMIAWLKPQDVHSVAILSDDNDFNHANAVSMGRAAEGAGMKVFASEIVPKGTSDLAPILAKLHEADPDRLIIVLGPSTAAFFHAYEASGWAVPLAGRIDLAAAIKAVSPQFLAAGGLAKTASVVVYTPLDGKPGVQDFARAYQDKYGIMPTQRAFYAYEAANLAVDAIRRAGSDKPEAIEAALKSTTMPSLLGGTYAMDDHNHSHTPMRIMGVQDGKQAVIATVE
jgi:branched-chain amino acid transport system substrate-binding protein